MMSRNCCCQPLDPPGVCCCQSDPQPILIEISSLEPTPTTDIHALAVQVSKILGADDD